MLKAKRPEIGDLFEVATPSGFAYLQYTHYREGMGALIRVLPGLFAARPADLRQLNNTKELYFVFYPLKDSIRKGYITFVSHQPTPDWAQPYPLMRWPGGEDKTGKTLGWKIFKASTPLTIEEHRRSPIIRELSENQKKLSILQLSSHGSLVKQIARCWTPERAEEFRLQDVAEAERRTAGRTTLQSKGEYLDHYLYFTEKADAQEAGKRLRAKGWFAEVRRGADGENWLTLAKQPAPIEDDIEDVREDLEALAQELHGEYDGWGASA